MKRALVIGKFMPLHKGHCALIRFAATLCDEVIVSLTYKPDDPIPGSLRFEWIKQEFSSETSIRPEISPDDFDNEGASLSVRMPLWATFLRKRFPKIDVVISSEPYGKSLATELGIEYVNFDQSRSQFPVSGSQIRKFPMKYWDFISLPARSYFVKKICLYGPESTGKSTMARHLALHYKTQFVPEVSREIIDTNEFSVEDIIRIGTEQTRRVIDAEKSANKLLFCDTDLITTEIYCRHYLHQIPQILFDLETQVTYDQYFLFETDVPWVADGIRDLGDRRQEMFQVFKSELDNRDIRYEIVRGDFSQREEFIKDKIASILSSEGA